MSSSASELYVSDFSKLSFAECRRLGGGGFFSGAVAWLLTRRAGPKGTPRPQVDATMEVAEADLSEDCRRRFAELAEEARTENFRVVAYQKLKPGIDPSALDSGSLHLLSADGMMAGILNYAVSSDASGGAKLAESATITLRRPDGTSVSFVDTALYLDPPPGKMISLCRGASLSALIRRAVAQRERSPGEFIRFAGWRELSATHRREEQELLVDRRDRRKLYVAAGPS